MATILCDLLKAFDCVAHPKLIDAEVSRCGNSDCQCSCTKEPLHHTRVRFRYHPSPAAAGGCRCERSVHHIPPFKSVLSWTIFQELEQASGQNRTTRFWTDFRTGQNATRGSGQVSGPVLLCAPTCRSVGECSGREGSSCVVWFTPEWM